MIRSITLYAELCKQVPAALHQTLQHYWDDWQQACYEHQRDPTAGINLALLGKIWACSDFIARTCIRHPDWLFDLLAENIHTERCLRDYRKMIAMQLENADHDDAGIMRTLRQLRNREMLRIGWRDLSQCADVKQILYELSDLAEAFVVQTLHSIETQSVQRFGQPVDSRGRAQSMLVLAMGKMGGRELNFSSDIDLIFAYPETGETTGPQRTSYHEYFLWVAKKLIRYLHEITEDGFVYRVDTRLRPDGSSGALVMSFSAMENYYQSQGRNWERYAMVKARIITGRAEHRASLQTILTPFIYRRYLDYTAFASIREMKALINAQVKTRGMKHNIKLGHGGIREIEFIGQTFQLLRGGRDAELRVRGIVDVLRLLSQKGYIRQAESESLIAAYDFLRGLENRLQMQYDSQTHCLPAEPVNRQRLCLAMDAANWESLLQQLQTRQHFVARIFSQLIATDISDTDRVAGQQNPPAPAAALLLFWQDADNTTALLAWLSALGYAAASEVHKQLLWFRDDARIKRLETAGRHSLLPLLSSLLTAAVTYTQSERLVSRVLRILQSVAGRSVYLLMLNEQPPLQQLLLRLCHASDWFAQNIARYPLLLDSLLNADDLFSPPADEPQLARQLRQQLKHIGAEHVENLLGEQMDRLRQFKRQQVFNVAILDIFYQLPVATVADRLTAIADVILKQALQLAWQSMLERYGEPQCVLANGHIHKPVLSIIAYGKLGGYELGYDSDLDIIFLHDSRGQHQQTAGADSIDNQRFFARVAQRLIHLLSTPTYAGILYATDTRLRPDGQSGLLVSSIAAFERYQLDKAWTWEHQALIRARFVSGSPHVESEFDRIRCKVLRQAENRASLLQNIVTMREKMRQHLAAKKPGFDVKQDTGGLLDIEFMVQAGVLRCAPLSRQCVWPTATSELIQLLVKAATAEAGTDKVGWFNTEQAVQLTAAYRYLRKLKNWQSLQCDVDVSELAAHRHNVKTIWWHIMLPENNSLTARSPTDSWGYSE